MTTTKEMVLVGGIVRALDRNGSWCGETHIQKTCFIAKHAFGLEIESDFVLYKHGPYSFDLNKSLAHMRARGVISMIARPGYGPSYEVNEKFWLALNNSANDVLSKFGGIIERSCKLLGKRNISDLEKISTAFYIIDRDPSISDIEGAKVMVDIKPHISLSDAKSSFAEARATLINP